MKACEFRHERAKVIKAARELVDGGEELTAEKEEHFNKMMADADRLEGQAVKLEKLETLEAGLATIADSRTQRIETGIVHADDKQARYSKAFSSYLRHGVQGMNQAEQFDLSLTNNAGGYFLTPVQLSDQFIVALNNAVFMRQLGTVEKLADAQTLGHVRLDTDISDPAWTSEVGAVSNDTSTALGRTDLTPAQLTKQIKESMALLNRSAGADQRIINRLAYKFAVAEENNFLNGTGTSNQPIGVFYASSSGIPTTRDVRGSNTTTAIAADTLYDMVYSLKAQYRRHPSIGWCMHRDVRKMVAKLKDDEHRYLLQPSLQAGQPDTLLGIPVYESEYAPNTFSADAYVAVLGCWNYYFIADAGQLEIQRLNELYAGNSQIGFIGRLWTTGAPVLAEAFSRCQLAAS